MTLTRHRHQRAGDLPDTEHPSSVGRSRTWVHRIAQRPSRSLPFARGLGIALRAVHLVGVVLLAGGVMWGIEPARLRAALLLTAASGAGLVTIELAQNPQWTFMGKGLAILAKVALLGLLPLTGRASPLVLGAVLVLSVVGAHLPSRYRHYSLLLGRPVQGVPKS